MPTTDHASALHTGNGPNYIRQLVTSSHAVGAIGHLVVCADRETCISTVPKLKENETLRGSFVTSLLGHVKTNVSRLQATNPEVCDNKLIEDPLARFSNNNSEREF